MVKRLDKVNHFRVVRKVISKRNSGWVEDKGYPWFASVLHPAIREVQKRAAGARECCLAAESLVFLGDIYDVFFDAPIAALRAYRRSVKLSPESAYAWREIGTMLHRMGDYKGAKRAWQRALRLDPTDERVQLDLECVEDDIAESSPVLCVGADRVWDASEWIARLKPRKAIEVLGRSRTVKALLCRVRAFEALGEHERVLKQWATIANHNDDVELDQADWFFMSRETWNAKGFWQSILAIGDRFAGGLYPKDDSFPDVVAPRKALRDGSKALRRLVRHRWKLTARLQLARLRRDVRQVRRLVNRYPQWKSARTTLMELSSVDKGKY